MDEFQYLAGITSYGCL